MLLFEEDLAVTFTTFLHGSLKIVGVALRYEIELKIMREDEYLYWSGF